MSGETLDIKTAILVQENCRYVDHMFDSVRQERIRASGDLFVPHLTPGNIGLYREKASELEALITCWGVPLDLLHDEKLFPALRIVFFSGGSIKYFARPLLERGIQVVSSRDANAVAVSDFCLGQIILSCKGYFRNTRDCRNPRLLTEKTTFAGRGLFGEKVSLIGLGAVARKLAVHLKGFNVEVLAVDPFVKPAAAEALGVRLVSLEQAFSEAYVISNHLPHLPELAGVFDRALFSSMRQDATFINTGRGPQVNESDLIQVFRQRTDLTALLDVTHPEPPVSESPLYRMPNIQLSSHIAGSLNDEWARLGDSIVEEFERYCQRKTPVHAESLEMLDQLA